MRIMVATGGAPHSQIAVEEAALWAAILPLEVTVLGVARRRSEQAPLEHALHAAQLELQKAGARSVETQMRFGRPADEIVRALFDTPHDLVMMGQRPRHNPLTRLLGPTTAQVIDRAPCTVLVAKPPATRPRRLLVCNSGVRDPSLLQAVLHLAPDLLQQADEVTVLHVMSHISAAPGIPGRQLRASAEELIAAGAPEGLLLADDSALLAALGVAALLKVRHGLVVDEVADEAASAKPDLVIIGAHQATGWSRFLLDNFARQLIEAVPRSILVVRRGQPADDRATATLTSDGKGA